MRRKSVTVAATISAAALAGALGGVGAYAVLGGGDTVVREVAPTTAAGMIATTTETTAVGAIYAKTSRSVVEIAVTSSGSGSPFRPEGTQQAQGSGFVYDRQGHVITNQHVVDGAESVKITFWNGTSYDAEVVGSDPSTDIAVLNVDAPASLLRPLALGKSSAVAVGDPVVAIGSPFGLEGTVTSGIVSALHREIESPNGFTIDDAIQTDAAINHGNSGGPLLDMQGEVIGVNAQIESESGGSDGVGFAVPSDTVRLIADQLIETGSVQHAYLGVGVDTVPAAVAEELDTVPGVAIASVRTGSPAAQAGLRAATGTKVVDGQEYPSGGDVITKLDGTAIESAAELRSLIDARSPGDTIRLTVVRGGKTRTVEVTLASRPDSLEQ